MDSLEKKVFLGLDFSQPCTAQPGAQVCTRRVVGQGWGRGR